jgi:transposase
MYPTNFSRSMAFFSCMNVDPGFFAEAFDRFAKTIRQDLEAVRNAVSEPWSNGQTEGQINKLKTLKRAMYGRAGVDLLRARMMPL